MISRCFHAALVGKLRSRVGVRAPNEPLRNRFKTKQLSNPRGQGMDSRREILQMLRNVIGGVMKRLWLACSFAALLVASPAQAASLIGDTVTCEQVGAGSTYSCFTNSAVVGGGREFVVGAAPNPAIGLNFNGGGLRISNISGGLLLLTQTVISLSDLSKAFTSANLNNSSIVGFGNSDISIQSGVLQLNFANTFWLPNATAFVALDTASAVPEPGTWAMMLLGLGAMGAAMRSRRRQKVSVRYA